ncbi:T9SS type A sorting domain-containing protein [Subsaximicrobium wynnwilliamsii]|uniref:T9SS type A sorting domain-containing protein n=1 Tax=Subsaximicrobium wynnwilliamsii TaxID=291179 RepID=A0A5C6ZDB8_9FLAO|nr:T9SS type A sorting domain-containing protein [Subsaximicrobium wynnwilliamsii]TXD82235.1 T9SS type A sorting domain-containing protein [Subsaximicrobium wynnwilliamsii]TXD87875.1 T9SS type A sorting domain-containing protein [Subsaximicrobium wynnwilliamsii]TXE01825.1 T9SS type A sorting domain-containing protein [Subsaximicrobium wynnwilliamsii]
MKTKITKVLRSWCLLPLLLMSLIVQGRENSAIEIALGINDVTLISGVENFSISFEKERIWEVSPASISDLGGHEGDDNGPKITICHYPPGNPENVQTIEIAASAWPAHEAHGDTQGACSNDDDDDEGDDDDEDEEGCYAMEVIDYSPTVQSNGNAIANNRTDATVTLGEPDRANEAGGFASLGIGGQLTLRFSGAVYDTAGDDILIYETSFSGDNCSGANDERAMVEVSQDGTNWYDAGEICRDGAIDLDGIPVVYVTHIRITDITTGSGDGYDVDGVEAVNGCQDVPSDENDPCYGAFVVDNSYMPGLKKNGQPITDPERLDPSKALGVPQVDNTSNFVSLGYGGEITIGFDGLVLNQVGDDLVVVETTYGNATFASYPESADVYVSQDGFNFYFIGSVLTNESASLDISNASVALSYITQVRVVDTTPEGSVSPDGFDLDGIISLPGCTVLEDPNTCFSEIVNGGFEDDNTFAGSWKYVPQDEVPGWSTTSPTGTIEIQRSGMVDGNASNSGGFHFELNGDALNNIYQEICTTPGSNIEVSFSYMKRRNSGVDEMELYFSDAIETITDGTAYPFMATPGAGWETKSFVYAVPAGQESTIIFFKAVSGTSATIGNLLDDISVATTLASPTSLEELFAALSTKDQVLATTEVTMYPVPARDRLNVKLRSQLGGKVSYEIVSIMGQSLGRGSLDNYSGQGEIHADVSNLADGAYFLMIHLNGETISKKFIKATR